MTIQSEYRQTRPQPRRYVQERFSAATLIDRIVEDAYTAQASDIHLDPGQDSFSVRFRIDGMLRPEEPLPPELYSQLIARLKVLARLRSDEHHLLLDGRFRHLLPVGNPLDVRLSIMPTYHGQNAVLRLLRQQGIESSFSSLGFSEDQDLLLRSVLLRPHGMIIATGPTGSGKTTTLYALINLLRQRPISIVTIEDPVEYFIPGIRQIPVNMHAGFGFADALRSILRQDPDVIMVGEIRDAETARLAASAALTGHLVLCTLHASQGSGAFARLTDLGVEPYVVNATVSLVIAQRLLRKLCQTCRRTKTLTATEHAELLHRFGTYQPIAKEQFEPRGCAACRDGYLGRAGAYELIRMDEPVRESLRRGHGLEEAVRSQRVETIERHAVNKACAGMTSFDEVLRLAYA